MRYCSETLIWRPFAQASKMRRRAGCGPSQLAALDSLKPNPDRCSPSAAHEAMSGTRISSNVRTFCDAAHETAVQEELRDPNPRP
jgi:hypothetical protein